MSWRQSINFYSHKTFFFFQLTQVVWFLNLEKLTKFSFLLDIEEKIKNIFARESYIIEGIQGIPLQNNIFIYTASSMQFEILWRSVGCLKPQMPMHVYFPTRRGVIQLGPIHISIIGHLSIIIFPSYSPCSKSFSKGRGKSRPWQAALGCTPI
jgi:hypothetical protein